MIAAAALAFRDIFALPFRSVLVKSLALTLGLLAAIWLVLQWLINSEVALPYAWLDAGLAVLTGIGLLVGLGFLVAPVTALFAGLYLDDIAEVVERTRYPGEAPGRAMPFLASLATSLRFFGVVVLVNAVALPLVLVLGFGFLIFLVANAYLIGREYFELAARRHFSAAEVQAMRGRHAGRIFAAGLALAGVLAVPIVNLVAPLFATAMMVHLLKRIGAVERRFGPAR